MPRKPTTPATEQAESIASYAEQDPTPAELLQQALAIKPRGTPMGRHETARDLRYQAERDLVVAVLSKVIQALLRQSKTRMLPHIAPAQQKKLRFSEVVCIPSPVGQLAWILPPDRTTWFAHLAHTTSHKWDNHNAGERLVRLRRFLMLSDAEIVTWFDCQPTSARSSSPRAAARRRTTRKEK